MNIRLLKIILPMLFCAAISKTHAQYGLKLDYHYQNLPEFSEWVQTNFSLRSLDLNMKFWTISLDRRITLSQWRVEFYPFISLSRGHETFPNEMLSGIDFDYSKYGMGLGVQVYPFDLAGDCDCPTFGKNGNLFNKGFFLRVGTEITYKSFSIDDILDSSTRDLLDVEDYESLQPTLHLGVGIDIGINEQITVTPQLHYELSQRAYWPALLDPVFDPTPQEWERIMSLRQSLNGWHYGMRLEYYFARK